MPLVNRTFDQLIDFTRTSAATFVNSSGNIASTPQSRNLLTFTQEFDNAAWTKSGATITANSTTAPDGTSTADTFNATGGSAATLSQSMGSSSSGTYTASIYAKAGTKSVLQFSGNSFSWGSDRRANFDLANGVLGTVDAGFTATITAVGNGWYRCTVTGSKAATAGTVIFCAVDSTTAAREATATAGTIFIWGAQGEFASAATDYTRNFGGLFPPRFDYDPVTRAPRGLLIEEQRTNLLTYSEQFDNAAWTKSNATVTADAATSPDGTADADRLAATTTGAQLYQTVTLADSTTYAASVYLKKGSGSDWAYIRFRNKANNNFYLWANLATGVVGSTSGSPTSFSFSAAGNGWYRLSVVASSGTGATTPYVYVSSATGDTAGSPAASDELLVWGAQLEAGAFATSYIPTVASQVTRSADRAAINAPNFAPWYNQSEGTFVVEGATLSAGNTYRALAVTSDAAYQSRVDIGIGTGSGGSAGRFRDDIVVSGSVQAALGDFAAFAAETPYKNALAYKTNDFASATSGANLATDASGTVPTVALLDIGNRNGSNQLNGWVRSIRYYPTRLSNAQLQALTA